MRRTAADTPLRTCNGRSAILASPEPRRTLAVMSVESHAIEVETKGHSQVLDITDQVVQCVDAGAISCGIATVFVIGSTAAITTTEFEPGLASHDLAAALEKVAPVSGPYLHEETWHDDTVTPTSARFSSGRASRYPSSIADCSSAPGSKLCCWISIPGQDHGEFWFK